MAFRIDYEHRHLVSQLLNMGRLRITADWMAPVAIVTTRLLFMNAVDWAMIGVTFRRVFQATYDDRFERRSIRSSLGKFGILSSSLEWSHRSKSYSYSSIDNG
jgi:hypothetical protein